MLQITLLLASVVTGIKLFNLIKFNNIILKGNFLNRPLFTMIMPDIWQTVPSAFSTMTHALWLCFCATYVVCT